MLRAALTALALLALAAPAEAQLLKEIKESARQKVTERKERTRAHAVQGATEPVDSALERGIQPVDSFVAKAATGAGAAVSRLGREDEAAAVEAERRLKDGLALEGRADLPGLAFAPGADVPAPGADRHLAAVANVLAMEESVFLVEGRAGAEDPPGDRGLGERRAAAVKSALVSAGIPGSRLFTAGRQEPATGTALVSVVRMQ
jgi:outer membrane protein OmpA-like peptidoglycan-associated protein